MPGEPIHKLRGSCYTMPETTVNLSDLTLVAVFAHPDDEGFGCGGTLAMLAEKGAKLTLV